MNTSKIIILINQTRWVAIFLIASLIISCGPSPDAQHDHRQDAHDDHTDVHTLTYTDFTEQTELFLEFPSLIVNQASIFAAHVTRLADFQPLAKGMLEVVLKRDQKVVARFRVNEPARAGIFAPKVVPREVGIFDLLIHVVSEEIDTRHLLGLVTVFSDRASVIVKEDRDNGEITYLKEQQWDNPFALTQAKTIPVRASVQGIATVYASDAAEIGNLVGYMQSSSTKEEDYGEALVALEEARGDAELAQQEVKRLESLFQTGAIPEKHLAEARKGRDVAVVALKVAKARLQHHASDFNKSTSDKRWLHIRVPEHSAAQLQQVSGVWFKHGGQLHVLDVNNGARVIEIGGAVDPVSRTVPVVLEYPNNKGPTLIGATLTAHVYTQAATPKLAIPRSAIIDDGGRSVVYVQTGGESFTRRAVELGVQDGPWIEIISGVEASERVVSTGAYYVKLAAAGGEEIGHGHAH